MAGSDGEGGRIRADALAAMDLPPHALDRFLDLLTGDENLDAFTVPRLLGVSEHRAEPLLRLLANRRLGRTQVAVMLDAMREVKDRASRPTEGIELCWTGPPSLGVVEKSTESVMRDMIGRAQREIIVVGYRITGGGGLMTWLSDAMGRVGGITMIIDDDTRRANLAAIDEAFRGIRRPRIYLHKRKEKGFYKVHAKVTIIDGMEMLLTSANMTYHGLRRNFEMGVRASGRPAKDARSLVMKMIDSKYFEEM